MSLDELIQNNKKSGGLQSNSRSRGYASGPARRFVNRAQIRTAPYSIPQVVEVLEPAWRHEMVESEEDTGTKLYVSNLDYGVPNEDIKLIFSEIGDLKRYSINYDKSGRSKGTAEVVFTHRSDALEAIKRYNNVQLDGKPMSIELVGTSIVSHSLVPQTASGILGNPKGILGNPRGLFRRQEASGGRGLQGGGDLAFGRDHGQRRGRGQGKGRGEKISTEELDAELEKYHLDAMQIKLSDS